MQDNIDIDVSAIMSGEASITQMGEEIYQEILRVANGKTTKSEDLGHNEFSIYKIAPTFRYQIGQHKLSGYLLGISYEN